MLDNFSIQTSNVSRETFFGKISSNGERKAEKRFLFYGFYAILNIQEIRFCVCRNLERDYEKT